MSNRLDEVRSTLRNIGSVHAGDSPDGDPMYRTVAAEVDALFAVVDAAALVVSDAEVVWDGDRGEWRWQGRGVPAAVVTLRDALRPLVKDS